MLSLHPYNRMFYPILFLALSGLTLAKPSEKKGVGHWAPDFQCGDFEVLKSLNWWYDWSCGMDRFQNRSEELQCELSKRFTKKHVPMIWGFYPKTNYACHMESDSDAVLVLNEPNHLTQSNRLAADAAATWPLVDGNSSGKILVGPGVAHCGPEDCNADGNTTEYLDKFFAACDSSCRVDAIATHTYWCNVKKTMDFLTTLFNKYNKPLWLTEFACGGVNDTAKVLAFVNGILPELEASPFIHKYAWFKARIKDDSRWVKSASSLFEPDSSNLTPLGEAYLGFKVTTKGNTRKK